MIPLQSLDIAAVRARLQNSKGKMYWRTLEEVADSSAFEELIHNEFPRQAAPMPDAVSRRTFVKLMGASFALAGLSGCGTVGGHWRVPEKIIPYVESPEYVVPGNPLMFATAMSLGGVAIGLLAESHTGRPTKLEGNPSHPGSLGSADLFSQAAILQLYDPDRAESVNNGGRIRTWQNFETALAAQVAADGGGVRIVTEAVTSPTLVSQIEQFVAANAGAKWITWEPAGQNNALQGAALAFGQPVSTVYDFSQADIVLALDADFLSAVPANVRYTRDFMAKRRLSEESTTMNRLYVVEPMLTPTGSKADHRLALRASEVAAFGRAVGEALGVAGLSSALPAGVSTEWFNALVNDLQGAGANALVVVGDGQPPLVHAIGHAINAALGGVGTTLRYIAPLAADLPDENEAMAELVAEMQSGAASSVIILGGNPVFTTPAQLGFGDALAEVPFSAHLSVDVNETSNRCQWQLPATHFLEAWSDARAFDGSATIVQPLVEPLYGGRSAHEVMALLNGQTGQAGYDIVRAFWEENGIGDNFERGWRRAVHDGVVADSQAESVAVDFSGEWGATDSVVPDGSLEIVFRPDPTLFDGRFANSGWLQELPKPIVKLTWDNAAILSPATAERLGLANEDIVLIEIGERGVTAPVLIAPGHANESITVWLGGGRKVAGRVGEKIGFNAYHIRPSATPWFTAGTLNKVAGRHRLAQTQDHQQITHHLAQRHVIKSGTLKEFQEDPEFLHHGGHGEEGEEAASLYQDWEYNGYKWGMTIDLTSCSGCMACVAACQAENNIPVVGKTEVLRNRELHWLRVDAYYTGELDNPEVYNMPVPCMNCEKAPCEPVCPVGATVHDSEGLNNMVYNRCIGTRYCSNNCPYKVRRFNYLEHVEGDVPVLKLLRNPDVSVRTRGVMEKCTYCVQRISAARIQADKEQRTVEDADLQTACQATCPAQAITFGDLNNQNAAVTERAASPLNYVLLEELATKPRTTYLAAIRNSNDALASEMTETHG